MTTPLLTLKNIETYYGPIAAIRGVSLDIFPGKIVVILGSNGAGKTTILKTISGAMAPRKGTVIFQGREIQQQDPDQVARQGIAHVPEGREIFPLLTVHENLMMGAYSRQDQSSVPADLDMTYRYFPDLKSRARQQAGYLSGGQQQMLALGRALMARPQLMLLDEPSLGLAPVLVQEIFAIILRLRREQAMTLLLVEQNAGMALQVGDYGYVLEMGRIVMEATCAKLLESPEIQEFYLGLKDHGIRGKRRWKRRKTWR